MPALKSTPAKTRARKLRPVPSVKSVKPRRVKAGDVGPTSSADAIERAHLSERVAATTAAESNALVDILAGRSPEDARRLVEGLRKVKGAPPDKSERELADELAEDWRSGAYP